MAFVFCALTSLYCPTAEAQETKVPVTLYDLTAGAFVSPLPVNASFTLRVRAPKDTLRVEFTRWITTEDDCSTPSSASGLIEQNGVEEEVEHPKYKYFQFFVEEPLRSRKPYCFVFQGHSAVSDATRNRLKRQLLEVLGGALGEEGASARDIETRMIEALSGQDDIQDSGALISAFLSKADFSVETLAQLKSATRADQQTRATIRDDLKPRLDDSRVALVDADSKFLSRPSFTEMSSAYLGLWRSLESDAFAAFLDEERPSDGPRGVNHLTGAKAVRTRLATLQRAYARFLDDLGSAPKKTRQQWPNREDDLALFEELDAALQVLDQAKGDYAVARAVLEEETDAVFEEELTLISPNSVKQTSPLYEDESLYYISIDVGLVAPLFLSVKDDLDTADTDMGLYVGVSFSFDSIDKTVPLEEEDGLGKRLSLVAGINITDLNDGAGSISGIIGDYALMGGMGFRLTDYLKFGTGAVLFRQRDANPVSSETHIRASPYLSLSVDIDVVGTILDLLPSESKGDSKPQF